MNERKYKCEICSKSYNTPQILKIHQDRKACGKKRGRKRGSFPRTKCEFCSREFISQS